MGCGNSAIDSWTIDNIYREIPAIGKHRQLYTKMGFTEKDIAVMYNYFCEIDKDASRSVSTLELMDHIDMSSTNEKYWIKKVFSMFDDDGSGTIDFHEFTIACWSYCTLHRASLLLFAFDCYDTNHDGSLSMNEFNGLLKDLYGPQYRDRKVAVIAALEADALGAADGDFNIDDFTVFTKTHGALLAPAFAVQDLLRQKVAGRTFWSKMADKRVVLQNQKGKGVDTYVSTWELLDLHTHADYQLHPRGKHTNKKGANFAKYGRRKSRDANAEFAGVLQETGARGYRHKGDVSHTHHTNATTEGDYQGDSMYRDLVDMKYSAGATDDAKTSAVYSTVRGAKLYDQDTNIRANEHISKDRFDGEADDQTWMQKQKDKKHMEKLKTVKPRHVT